MPQGDLPGAGENDAFWSITVYGDDGFMKSDDNIVNSSNVKLNADGTFDVYYGSAESCADVPNRLDVCLDVQGDASEKLDFVGVQRVRLAS